MRLSMIALRHLIREALDQADPKTWTPYTPTTSQVHLWHVVSDSSLLNDIFRDGLRPGEDVGTESAHGGSPARVVYFFTEPEPARLLAAKYVDNDDAAKPAVLELQIAAKQLQRFDPRIDPEEEFNGASIAFNPDKRFVVNALMTVYSDDVNLVPARFRFRRQPLTSL